MSGLLRPANSECLFGRNKNERKFFTTEKYVLIRVHNLVQGSR